MDVMNGRIKALCKMMSFDDLAFDEESQIWMIEAKELINACPIDECHFFGYNLYIQGPLLITLLCH
jgi:hypothetical protein